MIKYFCDKCNVEINRDNQFEHKEFKVAKHVLTLSLESAQTTSDALCLHCVLDEIRKIDDRPIAG